jgi:hypothetical protein
LARFKAGSATWVECSGPIGPKRLQPKFGNPVEE